MAVLTELPKTENMSRLPITNDYPPDWPEINARACEEAGHRCIRCGHPYKKGTHGKGQWSPCDEQCMHQGPLAVILDKEDGERFRLPADMHARSAIKFHTGQIVLAEWRILTCHHMDGDKANCVWWNLLVLCQRCHLTIQGKVNPQQPYMFEHSDWMKPYVAGFYAKKYEGVEFTRSEVMARLDELLAHERLG